jgi:AraC-like DNA-binding protein
MRDFGIVTSLKTTLRVQRFADRLVPLIPFPHKHNFYHLLVVTAGKGWHEIDFARFPLERGRIYLMKPAQVHSWQLDKTAQGYVIEFEEELFKIHPSFAVKIQSLFQSLPDSFQITDKKEFLELTELCEDLLKEYEAKAPDYELVTSLELFNFLIRLSRVKNIKLKEPPAVESFGERFAALIEAHYNRHHDVEFYADKLHISAKALTMKMTRLSGKSARTLIQERLILEARRLLAYSEISVTDIAAQLGFEDANYFSRFFRLKTKHSPGTFRKKAKNLS